MTAFTVLRSYAVTQFHLLSSKIHKEWNSIYIILIYYNILYNINLIPQESAAREIPNATV
jgi:hypothetical protein